MTERERQVAWSFEALDDVDLLWDYYAGVAGLTTAGKVLREIAKAIATIRDFPFAGRSRDDLRPNLRSIAAGFQIVFYRLNGDLPEILRVIDSRRDIESIFTEDDSA